MDGRMFLASLKLFRPRPGKTPQSGERAPIVASSADPSPSEPHQHSPLEAPNAAQRSLEALHLQAAFPTLTSEQALFAHAFKSDAPAFAPASTKAFSPPIPAATDGPLPS